MLLVLLVEFGTMVDRYTLSWCHQYKPKYLFRGYPAYLEEIKEIGVIFTAEDSEELYTKKFRVVRNGESDFMKLIEISSEREAGDIGEAQRTAEERMKERDKKEQARRESATRT